MIFCARRSCAPHSRIVLLDGENKFPFALFYNFHFIKVYNRRGEDGGGRITIAVTGGYFKRSFSSSEGKFFRSEENRLTTDYPVNLSSDFFILRNIKRINNGGRCEWDLIEVARAGPMSIMSRRESFLFPIRNLSNSTSGSLALFISKINNIIIAGWDGREEKE